MDDAGLVRGLEGFGDLLGQRQCLGQRDRAMGYAVRECFALDEFEHERMPLAAVFEAIDGRDVRMVERGEHLRFPTKSSQPVRIADDSSGQNLQRDIAIELGVAGAIHLAHAAGADETNDFVGTESSAGGRCHPGGVSIGRGAGRRRANASATFSPSGATPLACVTLEAARTSNMQLTPSWTPRRHPSPQRLVSDVLKIQVRKAPPPFTAGRPPARVPMDMDLSTSAT